MRARGAYVVWGDGYFHFEGRVEETVLHSLHVGNELRAISQPSEAVKAKQVMTTDAEGCHCRCHLWAREAAAAAFRMSTPMNGTIPIVTAEGMHAVNGWEVVTVSHTASHKAPGR